MGKVFKLLSESLHNELQLELALPQLTVHPLFEYLGASHAPTMHKLATTSICHKSIAHGDAVFYPGESAKEVYFVETGRLQYIKERCANFERVDKREDWIAEPVLWVTSWIHLGVLVASMETDLLLVMPDKFAGVIRLTPSVWHVLSGYAYEFVGWLNSEGYARQSDIYQGE